MTNIVLSGATGLIGQNALPMLKRDHRVTAFVRDPRAAGSDDVQWVQYDLTDPVLPDSLPQDVDTVIHLAQSPHFREFPQRADHVFQVNVASTQRLLDWALRTGARRFIHASSGGIYGGGNQGFREDDTIPVNRPLGFYLASKRCGELLAESYAGHLTVIVLRFFFVYGRGQRRSMLIPRLVDSVRNGTPIQLQPPDGIQINPIHAGDAATAVLNALQLQESQRINIAGPQLLTLRQIGREIGRQVGREPIFEVDAESQPNHLVGNIARMTEILGPPRTTFAEGISELLAADHT